MDRFSEKLQNDRVYYIAEMSANHGNNLELALKTVDAAAKAGADCLKVQTYTADTMTLDSDKDCFLIKGGLWDGRRLHELYDEASFPWEWHQAVKERCEEQGMEFLSTPFDKTAVDFLDDLGVSAFKIASFECVDIPLIEYAATKGKRMIISTGMASLEEIADAMDACRRSGNDDIVLFRCQSDYPADPAAMNLSSIRDMKERFNVPIGFSDHSMGHTADVVAAVLGARVIEKHFCIDRDIDSADAEFSMTPSEYAEMIEAVDTSLLSLGQPEYGPSESEQGNLAFRRSVFACADIRAGEKFTEANTCIVRPAAGAKPKDYRKILNSVADRDYEYGDPIMFGNN